MDSEQRILLVKISPLAKKRLFSAAFVVLTCFFNIFSETASQKGQFEFDRAQIIDTTATSDPILTNLEYNDDVSLTTEITSNLYSLDSLDVIEPITLDLPEDQPKEETKKQYIFNPDPTRAVWMSALFPGLGQLYNRRYWKLPIVIGGFMGLGYATTWNNGMLRDYTRAYADIMDNDPNTKSYMDFFPSTTTEDSLDKTWLTNVLQSRKNYYRRNRDLCIICMVGVYLLAMVDAYVDASLAHFDISPDLSMDLVPAFIPDERSNLPGVGLQWALNF